MSSINAWVDELTEEGNFLCPCCGRNVFEGEGVLNSAEGELAYYAYQWSEGHQVRFKLGICALKDKGEIVPGLAAVSCHCDGANLIYSILEPEDSPWAASDLLGPILSRNQVLQENRIPNIFSIVDAIAANDKRISGRILAEKEYL